MATLSSAAPCGSAFELDVGSTGEPPYTRVGPVTFAGTCAPPAATAPPTLHRTKSVVRATPGTWNAPPVRVVYRWQRCARRCAPIAGAASLTPRLGPRDAGSSIRIVATATFDAATVAGASAKLPIRRLLA